jgi:hypothetical protein
MNVWFLVQLAELGTESKWKKRALIDKYQILVKGDSNPAWAIDEEPPH